MVLASVNHEVWNLRSYNLFIELHPEAVNVRIIPYAQAAHVILNHARGLMGLDSYYKFD